MGQRDQKGRIVEGQETGPLGIRRYRSVLGRPSEAVEGSRACGIRRVGLVPAYHAGGRDGLETHLTGTPLISSAEGVIRAVRGTVRGGKAASCEPPFHRISAVSALFTQSAVRPPAMGPDRGDRRFDRG